MTVATLASIRGTPGLDTYLPASVRRFPGPEDLAAALRAVGFERVEYRRLGGGIIALHVAS